VITCAQVLQRLRQKNHLSHRVLSRAEQYGRTSILKKKKKKKKYKERKRERKELK
jgi:hypothetical protein